MKNKLDKFEDRKNLILKQAVALLIQQGSRPFSMRALANFCGMTLGNLQYYFPNLEALLEAIFDSILQQATQKISQLDHHEAQLQALIDIVLENLEDVSLCTLSMETWLAAKHSEKLHAALCNFYQRYLSQVAALIQLEPSISNDAIAHEKALMLIALFEGLAILYSHRSDSMFNFDLSHRLRQTVQAIMQS